jgi:CubicO group peptidase (beta-lactamase class C family)
MQNSFNFKTIGSIIAIMLLNITQPEYAYQDQETISRPSYKISPEIESIRKQITGIVEKYGATADLPGISYEFYYLHEPVVVAGKELGPSSPVSIASTSKSFTSFAVLRLAREGKIDLDAPISKYLPDFSKYELDRRHPVTVRHLLQHRSGIPYAGGKGIYVNGIYIPAPRVPAGRYFEYSNLNYELVASIMERVTGKPYKVLMEELVFRPLKLKNTYLAGYAHGSSGVVSTTSDMSAFADFLIQDYELYREGSFIQELARPPAGVPSTGNQEYYGLGWRVTLKNGAIFSMYHAGDWHQGVSLLMIYPQHSASFAYLANPPDYRTAAVQTVKGSMLSYSTLLVERLAKSTAQLPLPPRTPAARAPANSYLGKYKSEYNGVTIKVLLHNNRLAIERAGKIIPLVPINDWEFQGDSEYLTYQFFFDEKNTVVGVTDYTSYYAREDL